MDDVGKWNGYILSQRRLIPQHETELILTLTVPLVADQDHFRVGWDLKRPSGRGFVAITTGRAQWERTSMRPAAEHIWTLMDECNHLLEPMRNAREG